MLILSIIFLCGGLNEGSEHKIETTSYGGEVKHTLVALLNILYDIIHKIQLVHFSEKYSNYEEAKAFKVDFRPMV